MLQDKGSDCELMLQGVLDLDKEMFLSASLKKVQEKLTTAVVKLTPSCLEP